MKDFKVPTAPGANMSPDIESNRVKQAEWAPNRHELAALITMAVVSLMVALDATILVPALPALALDLNGSATDAFWAGTSYLLTSAVFQPFIASLSDIFGRKEMLLISIFVFTLGTLLCAPIAKDITTLLAGRSIQGIGGGGIITLSQVIYADIVPLRQRPKYFAMVLGTWAVGTVIGPLVGGTFTDRLSWRWCFYINFPLCAVGFVLVPLFVNLTTQKSPFLSKLKRVDWVGAFLFVGGMATFLIGLSWAGIQFAWASVQALVPICVGISTLGLAIAWESYFAKEPFITVSLFSSVSAVAAYAGAFCNGFILFCALYYAPLYFMAVRFTTPIQSGINILPVTCFLLPGSILVSILSSRLGQFRWAIWIGWAITACGCGFFVLLDQQTTPEIWATILAIFGIGTGMVLTSLNVAIQAISPAEDCGRAAAMYSFMRSLGMTIGVAVGGTTFQNVMVLKLKELSLPSTIAKNAEIFIEQLKSMEPTDPTRIGAIKAYIHGLRGVFWLITGVAIAGFVMSTAIRKYSMDKMLESKFVLKSRSHMDGDPQLLRSSTSLSKTNSRDGLLLSWPSIASSTQSPTRLEPSVSGDCEKSAIGIASTTKGLRQLTLPTKVPRRKPLAEAYYLFPNGARIPTQIPSRSARSGFYPNSTFQATSPHPNIIPGLTSQQRVSLILQREAWS